MSQRSLGSGFALIAALVLSACSGDNDIGVDNTPPPSGDAGDGTDSVTPKGDAGTPVGNSYSVALGPVSLAPGEEKVVCVDRRLPTDHAIDVVKIAADLTLGGHHLVFYKSDVTTENTTPTPCRSFQGVLGSSAPLFIAQKAHTELNFPSGIAYSLPAAQMVRVEMHFLNTTSSDLAVTGTVRLGEAVNGTVTDHANLMFYGTLGITIPPMATQTIGPKFHAFKSGNPKIFGLTGHQHHRGTGFTIELGAKDGAMNMVYENHDWAEPPLTVFDPPIATSAGQGLRYTCTYNNPTNSTVSFGEGANQEMCFLWAYYYPDMGFDLGFD
jgi:Copper type II ascorbate-dependent monooxygenase, C-terminal domain